MFDVGFTELVMIALVALLVVGPERLPELVRNTGRWIGRFQRIAREMRAELDRDIGREEFTRLQQDLRSTTSERINVDVTPAPTVTPKPTEPGGPV